MQKQTGFAHILLVLLLLAGLAVGVYLVQQKTNILPKAYEQPSTTIAPMPKYHIDKRPRSTVPMVVGEEAGTLVFASLVDKSGRATNDQQGLRYDWTIENNMGGLAIASTSCVYPNQTPCRLYQTHLQASSTNPGSAGTVWVKVTKISTNEVVAQADYYVVLLPSDNNVRITHVKPGDFGTETYKVGQTIPVSWKIEGSPVDPVRYYNVTYSYYRNRELKGGVIGTVQAPGTSIDWTIPDELAGQNDVVIAVEARIESNNGGGWNYSVNPFAVEQSGFLGQPVNNQGVQGNPPPANKGGAGSASGQGWQNN